MAESIKPPKEGFSLTTVSLLLIAYKSLVGIAISFIVTIAGGIIAEVFDLNQQQLEAVLMFFLNRLFLYSIINLTVIVFMYKSAKRRGMGTLNYLGREHPQAYPLVVLTVLGYILFFQNTLMLPLKGVGASGNLMENITENPSLMFFVVVIIGPLLEEILYRGIILESFLKRYSPIQSIVFSSLLFALMHLNLYQSINVFLLVSYSDLFM